MSEIGEALDALRATIEARRGADPAGSYTAALLARGPEHAAKKLGEEAVEAALAGALGKRGELVAEAADVLYHLSVLLASREVDWDEVAEALRNRRGRSGHAEKASRQPSS
jgi:phosphoribosyl-ATP pyrophosphohydrolase